MKERKQTDKALIEEFQNGSLAAFEELVARYETKSYSLAMRYMRNQEDAEEVLQDVFTTVYRKIGSFQGKSAFSSWLYRIVVNTAFMKLRKNKQRPTIALEDLSPGVRQQATEHDPDMLRNAEAIASNSEMRDNLQSAINRLPYEYRAVFVLRDVDGLSNQEVGEILGLTLAAVKSRLHRSRLMLRKKLNLYYKEIRPSAAANQAMA